MWGQAPNEIEAALAFRGIDIGWWHRFTLDDEGFPRLSSRRLLALLDELPDLSGYKTALRDGGWPSWMLMLKQLTNEATLHRASLYAGGDNEYSVKVFVDPIEAREQKEQKEAEEQFRRRTETKIYSSLGWT